MTRKTKQSLALATALLICASTQFDENQNVVAPTPPPQKTVTTIAPIEVASEPQAPKQEVDLNKIPVPTLSLESEILATAEPTIEPKTPTIVSHTEPTPLPEPQPTDPIPQSETRPEPQTTVPTYQPDTIPEPQPTTPPTSVLTPTEPPPSDDMIWVAGFGWLPSGEPAVTIEAESTGDINKMVGIM